MMSYKALLISVLTLTISLSTLGRGNGSGGGAKKFVLFETTANRIDKIHASVYLENDSVPKILIYLAKDWEDRGRCSTRPTFTSYKCSVDRVEITPSELVYDKENHTVIYNGQIIGKKVHTFLGLNDRWIKLSDGVSFDSNMYKNPEGIGDSTFTLELTLAGDEE